MVVKLFTKGTEMKKQCQNVVFTKRKAKDCSHVTILEDSGAKALVNLHFWDFCPFFSIMEQGFNTQSPCHCWW